MLAPHLADYACLPLQGACPGEGPVPVRERVEDRALEGRTQRIEITGTGHYNTWAAGPYPFLACRPYERSRIQRSLKLEPRAEPHHSDFD